MAAPPTSGDDEPTLPTADSDSLAFLRELARVSERSPNNFDLQLAGNAAAPKDELLPTLTRFQVRRRLGAGGFGVVYEALDRERNAVVALKALRRSDWRSISRFKNEFRSLVETMHPHLVQLYELHHEGEAWFFTMELVSGEDVLSTVRPDGSLEAPRLRAVLRQFALGLEFLHSAGKLHCDLKPSNVLVSTEGRVVIVDFGLVRVIDGRSNAEGVCGTPAYMAPEQAAGLAVGPAADWYAVGVMLHEALTGRLPARGAAAVELSDDLPEDLRQLCLDLLVLEPERRPTGGEVCVRLGLAGDTTHAGPPGTGDPPFIGRTAQLAALHDALAAADGGRAVVVRLSGGSGLGKTALAQRFLAGLGEAVPQRLVLAGRCYEQESAPYKGVDGLIDDLCAQLRQHNAALVAGWLPPDFPLLMRLFPQLRLIAGERAVAQTEAADEPVLRLRAFAALRDLLGRAGPPAPVLLVDDLQWGDLDGAALLTGLLSGAPPPLLMLLAYRADDAETSPVLRDVLAALDAMGDRVDLRRVEVGALDTQEAKALARALLDHGGPDAPGAAQALAAEARGDPSLLAELAHRDPGAWDLMTGPGGAAEAQLDPLLSARIGRMPASARRLLEVVALDGQPVERAVATHAAYGRGRESDALGALGLLRAGRLIRGRRTERGEEILPYHDRIRAVVTRGLDPETRRGTHERLARALEGSPAVEPERLLFHYRNAGLLGDAARYAGDAARRAHEALAFDRAARLYREALAFDGNSVNPGNEPLRVALAQALAGAGRPREAAHAWLDAARGAPPGEALDRTRRAAELLLGAGYEDEGLAALQDLGVTVSTSLPRSLVGLGALRLRLGVRGLAFRERPESAVDRGQLLRVDAIYAAAMGLFLNNPILAAESQARHLLLALEAGEPLRVARALALEAVFAAVRQVPEAEVERLLSTARGLEERVGNPQLTGLVRLCEAQVLQVAARFRPALERMIESESVLRQRCTGVALEIDLALFRQTDLLWNLGEVAELASRVPAIVEEARERGNRYLEMTVQLSTGSLLGLVADRPERATEVVETTLARWTRAPGSMVHVREIRARARMALYEGRSADALRWLEEGLSAMWRTGLILAGSHTGELRLLQALAALSLGDDTGAAAHIRAFRRLGFVWTENPERIVRAGLARRAGDCAGANRILEEARVVAVRQGAALYAHAMARRLGEWRGDEGSAEIAAAEAWMAGQGIAAPERMTALLLGWV